MMRLKRKWRTRSEWVNEWLIWLEDQISTNLARGAQLVGKLLVMFATVLISLIVISFELTILPYCLEHQSRIMYLSTMIIGHWLLVNIVFNYYMAITTKPGHPTPTTYSSKLCSRCSYPKPPRAHHCSICSRCVLRMDHHCPWIDNCVGFYNHRYFFLFSVYTTIGCVYTYVIGMFYYLPSLYPESYLRQAYKIPYAPLTWKLRVLAPFTVIPPIAVSDGAVLENNQVLLKFTLPFVLCFLCLAVSFVLLAFSLFHGYLISVNSTTIDCVLPGCLAACCLCRTAKQMSEDTNPFDMGYTRNWFYMFDVTSFGQLSRRILLPCAALSTMDGTHFPERPGMTMYV